MVRSFVPGTLYRIMPPTLSMETDPSRDCGMMERDHRVFRKNDIVMFLFEKPTNSRSGRTVCWFLTRQGVLGRETIPRLISWFEEV